jgi:putative FmdB family regulatory protein
MIIYSFTCSVCDISFDRDGKMSNPPKRKKCPSCGKQAPRAFCAPNFKVSGSKVKTTKSDVKRLYNEMIDDSKQRLKTQKSPYARYSFDPNNKKAVDGYKVRKATEKEQKAREATAKNLGNQLLNVFKEKKVL